MRHRFHYLCLYKNLDNDCKRFMCFIWICRYLSNTERGPGKQHCMAETSAGSFSHLPHDSRFSSPGLRSLSAAPSCSCCLRLGSGFLANEEFSAHLPGDGQSATQQEPEIFTLEFQWKLLHLNWRLYFSSSCLTLNCLSEEDWALV